MLRKTRVPAWEVWMAMLRALNRLKDFESPCQSSIDPIASERVRDAYSAIQYLKKERLGAAIGGCVA